MTTRIKNPAALSLEQRLEAAQFLDEQADKMQEDLDGQVKTKVGKNGEIIQDGSALTPIEIRRLRQDILDRRLEALALRGSAQESDLATLRRTISALRRRNEQLEQLVRMHGLSMPGYEEWTAPVVAVVADVDAVRVAAPEVVEAARAAKVERAKKPRGKAAVAMVSAGPAAVVKGGDAYEPRYKSHS